MLNLRFSGLLIAAVLASCASQPTADEMTAEFFADRNNYEQLADMAAQDGGYSRISYKFTHPDWSLAEADRPSGLSESRWQSYREQFDHLHLENGVTIYDQGKTILLERSASGTVTAGSSVAFWRTSQLPEGTLMADKREPLACDLGEQGRCRVARHLIDNWYVVLERH